MAAAAEHTPIAVIGAGIAGIGLAVSLRAAGFEDFLILERAADLGGTWQANTYPGCACDVPSQLYSYSFAPNPD
ncbi:NAD(P)-binding protein, partial [Nocardia cyriacigeorgica]